MNNKTVDSLVLDVMKYRVSQKLDLIRPMIKGSEKDPIGFLSSQILSWCKDMKGKIDTKPIYRESMEFLLNTCSDDNRFHSLYSDFFVELKSHWEKCGVIESMDITGVINVIVSVAILLFNSKKTDERYFKDIIKSFTEAALGNYIKTKEK